MGKPAVFPIAPVSCSDGGRCGQNYYRYREIADSLPADLKIQAFPALLYGELSYRRAWLSFKVQPTHSSKFFIHGEIDEGDYNCSHPIRKISQAALNALPPSAMTRQKIMCNMMNLCRLHGMLPDVAARRPYDPATDCG